MRPVGKRIREACEVLEQYGPMGSCSVCDYIDGADSFDDMGKFCSRAVTMGLMTVERGLGNRYNYSVFTVVPNWRDIADKRRPAKPAGRPPNPVVQKTRWAGIASVFNMGAA